jgi:transcription elongation factor Elf1
MALWNITPHPNKIFDCSFCNKKQPTLYAVLNSKIKKDSDEKEGFMICSFCWLKVKIKQQK